MLRRIRPRKDGSVYVTYFYNGRDENGKRIEIPLGTDLYEAKIKWAKLEKQTAPDRGLMAPIFDRYERDIIPPKAPRTQKDNLESLRQLRKSFETAPIDSITPQHIALYRDNRSAKVRANREISLLSHIFNMAREWGYTAKENPVRGVRKNRERPRDFYADDAVWNAVYQCASLELRDAMDITYLSGQRRNDSLKMRKTDIINDHLQVIQGKIGKKLLIALTLYDEHGKPYRTGLGKKIDEIYARGSKVSSVFLISTPAGQPLTPGMLRLRFDEARADAIKEAEKNDPDLAHRIRQFQFRDIRAKAASEIDSLEEASMLLGHTEKQITKDVYRRADEKVKPTK
ncbi:site-specific integrase [Oxalobacter vibrioformis]|uniref:Site-specific integrase n=1 Tax=Oxalobacter vibrioformis TaxID=933080 RepID=A0A9E9LYI6_9BURK|nr:tyrosine-type recombinase/integrase [Oxalobacter vibrioformis]WAW09804.1 site-specific integrase [Oxalobacter vibrioformis]